MNKKIKNLSFLSIKKKTISEINNIKNVEKNILIKAKKAKEEKKINECL